MTELNVRGLRVRVGSGHGALTAVDGVDLDLESGSVVGLVGESGSGKSTLARTITGILPPIEGRMLLDGHDYARARGSRLRDLRRRVQLVFQDPNASLNPRMTIGEALGEAASVGRRMTRSARQAEVKRLLDLVALEPAYAQARPRALSGGQRQRVALARAMAVRPDVIVADEITSALDASIQASVLNLLRDLIAETGLGLLFISHDLAVVRYVSDTAAVMHLGRIVERGPTEHLLDQPEHPYTRTLIESVSLDGFAQRREGDDREPPDPLCPPSGCRFRTICPVGPLADPQREVCRTDDPARDADERRHHAACHFASRSSVAVAVDGP